MARKNIDVADLNVNLNASSKGFRDEVKQAQVQMAKSAQAIEARLGGMERQFAASSARIKASFTNALGALAGKITVQGFANAISSLDDLGDKAQAIGLTAEEFQRLSFAADQAGVDIAGFDTSISKFVRGLGEAQAGGGKTKDVLDGLGVAYNDASGKARSTTDVLADVADKMAGIENPAQRVQIAFQLFGRSGASMTNLLSQGGTALQELSSQAVVVSNDVVDAAGVLNNRFKAVTQEISTYFKTAVVGFSQAVGLIEETTNDKLKKLRTIRDNSASITAASGGKVVIGTSSSTIDKEIAELEKKQKIEEKLRIERVKANSIDVEQLFKPIKDNAAANENRKNNLRTKSPKIAKAVIDDFAAGGDILKAIQQEKRQAYLDSIEQAAQQKQRVKETIADLQFEADQIGRTAAQQKYYNTLKQIGGDVTDEQREKILQLTETLAKHQERMARLQEISDSISGSVSKNFEDAIVNGKKLSEVLQGLGQDLLAIATRTLISSPLQQALGQFLGDSLGGVFGGGSTSAGATGVPSSGNYQFGGGGNTSWFADGGIMTKWGKLPLKKYADGGIARTPQAAIWGERGAEAFVPLKNGAIPVNVRGMGGGTVVQIIDQRSSGQQVQVQSTNNGQQIQVLIADAVASDIGKNGKIGQAIQRNYNVSRVLVQR